MGGSFASMGTKLPKELKEGTILICGGVGHFFDRSVDLSDTKQGQTGLMSNSKCCY